VSRILLVEDNPANRRLVRDLLKFRGHEVVEANDGSEFWAKLWPLPDVVLMDLQMPGESGEQILARIRSDDRIASLPVVAVTASAMAGDKERLMRAGFDGYLSKPIDVRSFGSVVESFVKKAGTAS
jgi:CheY-like chemotaxis protein